MTSTTPSRPDSFSGASIVDNLKARYEGSGFTFDPDPVPSSLPSFFGSFRPLAVARKNGQNVAIEVTPRRAASGEWSLETIREMFAGQREWRLDVIYAPGGSTAPIPAFPAVTIQERAHDVTSLNRQGHGRAAFLLAWSLLEAALHALGGEAANQPRTPGAVVQALAMNGHISPEAERRLRGLTELRNRIAHGDLSIDASSDDVITVLSAIQEALTAKDARERPSIASPA